MCAVLLAGKSCERPPSTAYVENFVAGLEVEFPADDLELVVLELLEGLVGAWGGDDAGCVYHARAEEERIEVVAAVIVVADLFFVCYRISLAKVFAGALRYMQVTLGSSVQDHLWDEAEKKDFEEIEREVEARPVVSILQYLETISFELDIAVKVQCLESVDWYFLLPFVLIFIRLLEEVHVGLDWSAGQVDFLVLAGCEA